MIIDNRLGARRSTLIHKPTFATVALVVGLAFYLISVEVLTAALRAHGRVEPGLFVLLRTFGWYGWLGWWYEVDARERGKTPGLDLAHFWMMAWPLILIGRLFAPGRKQALFAILLVVTTHLVAKVAGLTVFALLN